MVAAVVRMIATVIISLLSTLLSTLFGITVGGVIAYFVTRHVSHQYYKRASEDLERVAVELKDALKEASAELIESRRQTKVVLHVLQQAGYEGFRWDEKGNPIGTARADITASWNVERRPWWRRWWRRIFG